MPLTIPMADRRPRKRDRHLRAVHPSHQIEKWYRGQLASVVRSLRAFGAELLRDLRPSFPTARDAMPAHAKETIKRGRHKFQVTVPGAGADIAAKVVRKNLDEVDLRLAASVKSSVGVDIRAALKNEEPVRAEMRTAARENVELISSIPTEYFDKLEGVIEDAWDKGLAYDKLSEMVGHVADVTEARADLIARDQTSKMNSAFNRVRQTSVGIKRFEWQTAGDEDVRDSHEELDGKVFEWDDPPIVDGEVALPGEPYNCRCVGAPVLDDFEEADVEAAAEEGDDFAEDAAA